MISNLSHSSISVFAECPQRWYQEYILKNKAPQSEAANFGSAFDVLVALKLGIQPKTRENKAMLPAEIAALRAVEGVEAAVAFYFAQPDAWQTADDAQVKLEITPNQWATMAEMLGVSSQIHVPIIGYLDLIRKVGVQTQIVDLKTSTRTQFMPRWAGQLGLYALAKEASLMEIHLLVRLSKGLNFATYPYFPSQNTLRWVMEYYGFYADLIRQVEQRGTGDGLARSPDYYCEWCPLAFECEGSLIRAIKKRSNT